MPDDPGMQHFSGQASVRDRASMNNCMNNSGLQCHLRVREAGTESRRMVSAQYLADFWLWFFFNFPGQPTGRAWSQPVQNPGV